MPVWSMISRPTTVLVSWNAGRQCMNLTAGLPALSSRAAFTWYGVRIRTRSVQTSLGSPIDTHTSVWMKSTPDTASAGLSVTVIRAPVRAGDVGRQIDDVLGGCSSSGPASRTSLPISAPITSRERPMLKRQSPTNA